MTKFGNERSFEPLIIEKKYLDRDIGVSFI